MRLFIIFILICLSGCNRNRPAYQVKKEIKLEHPAQSKTDKKGVIQNIVPEDMVLNAKIIRILDGDTVEILYNQLPIKLRLEHIDAPEKRGKQPFGNKAKIVLSDLCFGQMVNIHSDGKFDRNGRLIGEIFNEDGLNLNKEMVRLGMAWHFIKYSDDISYKGLEEEARAKKVGLWQDSNVIPPWNFR